MVLHFNVTKDKRKAMVQAIEKKIGGKAKYHGVPSYAYEIGNFTVGKNGELEFGDFDDLDEVAPIIDACVLATGVSPAEWGNNEEGAEQPNSEPNKGAETGESLGLTVSIPLEKVDMGNLVSLLEAKGELIKKALGIENVHIEEKDEVVNFPWFEEVKPEEALDYTKFISAILTLVIEHNRCVIKEFLLPVAEQIWLDVIFCCQGIEIFLCLKQFDYDTTSFLRRYLQRLEKLAAK